MLHEHISMYVLHESTKIFWKSQAVNCANSCFTRASGSFGSRYISSQACLPLQPAELLVPVGMLTALLCNPLVVCTTLSRSGTMCAEALHFPSDGPQLQLSNSGSMVKHSLSQVHHSLDQCNASAVPFVFKVVTLQNPGLDAPLLGPGDPPMLADLEALAQRYAQQRTRAELGQAWRPGLARLHKLMASLEAWLGYCPAKQRRQFLQSLQPMLQAAWGLRANLQVRQCGQLLGLSLLVSTAHQIWCEARIHARQPGSTAIARPPSAAASQNFVIIPPAMCY